MGVILQVALRPLVLGAGRLQRGAARAGARPRHGMCAEQADLATRLHHRHGRATSRKTALFSCGWAPLGSRSVFGFCSFSGVLLCCSHTLSSCRAPPGSLHFRAL